MKFMRARSNVRLVFQNRRKPAILRRVYRIELALVWLGLVLGMELGWSMRVVVKWLGCLAWWRR